MVTIWIRRCIGWDEHEVESGDDRASGFDIVAACAISPYRHNPERIL